VSRWQKARWGVFVHDVDGDSGYGCIVGPFYDVEAAEAKAEVLRRQGDHIEAIVLPIEAGATSAKRVASQVTTS